MKSVKKGKKAAQKYYPKLILIFSLSLLISLGYYLFSIYTSSKNIITDTPNYDQVKVNNLRKYFSAAGSQVTVYSSQKLGVRIYSLVKIKEIDNKIYGDYDVDELGRPYGQFIEVFEKDPKLSLKEAVESIILKNYSKDKCLVVENGPTVEINDVNWKNFEDPRYCPDDYSMTNGERHFEMNPNFPDRLLFISTGQYAPMWDYELF